jgi:thiamine-monophosphate kinase
MKLVQEPEKTSHRQLRTSKGAGFPPTACNRYSGPVVPLTEKALISRIRRTAVRRAGVASGIGDDCAVLRIPPGHEVLVTTDFTLEDTHFRREWHGPEIVGHRCLTRGLSDIAAMGGEPMAAFLSLALPRNLPQAWVQRFMKGLLALAGQFKVTLAGGDTAESPAGICADIVVVGSVPTGQALLRSGAHPGDRIYVTGELGGSSVALAELQAGRNIRPADFPRHFRPVPRVAVGLLLREMGLATALIDLSDGLSTDLAHICEESGTGAEILAPAIPRARVGKRRAPADLPHALHGGEDYELLFTAPRNRPVPNRIAGVAVSLIGRVTRNKQLVLMGEDGLRRELKPQGWEHFRK